MSTEQLQLRDGHGVPMVKPSDEATNLLQVISQAVADPRMDVEKMKALLDMHERIMKDQRQVAFAAAMTRLQAKLPSMKKHGVAKNSKYARLEDIHVVIKPLLAEEGFSFSFDEESCTDKTQTFIAKLSHREGHSETKRLTVAIDTAATNRDGRSVRPAIQDNGSTVSYARRYLIKMHLDIVEEDEDTNGESLKPITDEQTKDLIAMVNEAGMDKDRFLVYMQVGEFKDILAKDWQKALTAVRAKNKK